MSLVLLPSLILMMTVVLPSAWAFPGLSLSLFTDKPNYYLRQNVNVQGNLAIDGSPVSDGLVGIQVNNPYNNPFAYRTVNTGTNPTYTPVINVTDVFLIDQNYNPKNNLEIQTPLQSELTATFNVTMKSSGNYPFFSTLTICDSNGYILGANRFSGSSALGTISTTMLFPISRWVTPGYGIAYANVYSAEPKAGGIAYVPEKSFQFLIVRDSISPSSSSRSINPPPVGTYSSSLKLSPTPLLGAYTVYTTASYGGQQVTASAAFTADPAAYPPQASFTYSPPTPYVSGTVTFDASASTPEGGNITSYIWNFGDGTPIVTKTGADNYLATHVFSVAGTFTATLNVTDTDGLWSTTSKPIKVSQTYGPTANFTYSPATPYVSGVTTFDASTSTPGWNGTTYPPIIQYKWNFSDGPLVTSGDPITTHIFTSAKNYTVTLNVTDSIGKWSVKSQLVRVISSAGISDVAVVAIKPPSSVYQGFLYPIMVNVTNKGFAVATFNVTLSYNITLTQWATVGTQTVTGLNPQTNQTLTFNYWNTTGLTLYANYQLRAIATLQNDTNPSDNTLIVTKPVKLPGDIDGNRMVNYLDLGALAISYGSKLGGVYYNPDADIDANGRINYLDLGSFAVNYGKKV